MQPVFTLNAPISRLPFLRYELEGIELIALVQNNETVQVNLNMLRAFFAEGLATSGSWRIGTLNIVSGNTIPIADIVPQTPGILPADVDVVLVSSSLEELIITGITGGMAKGYFFLPVGNLTLEFRHANNIQLEGQIKLKLSGLSGDYLELIRLTDQTPYKQGRAGSFAALDTSTAEPANPGVSRFRDLSDVNWEGVSDLYIPRYDLVSDKLIMVPAPTEEGTGESFNDPVTSAQFDANIVGELQLNTTKWWQLISILWRKVHTLPQGPTEGAQSGSVINFAVMFQTRSINGSSLTINSVQNAVRGSYVHFTLTSQNAADNLVINIPGWTVRRRGYSFVPGYVNIIELRVVSQTSSVIDLFIDPQTD